MSALLEPADCPDFWDWSLEVSIDLEQYAKLDISSLYALASISHT